MNIVFFDGYCGVCNHFVDWLMRIDKTHKLKFASLQGETAAKVLGRSESVDIFTVIYMRDQERSEQSTAILNILSDIGGAWLCTKIFFFVPKFIRDAAYRLFAKNRYRLSKKRETCRIPTPSERERLLP